FERSLFHLLGHPETVTAQALPEPKTIDGVTYHVAFVKSDKVLDWTLYFDADGWLARMEYQGEGPSGPAHIPELMSDWRPEGALKYPHGHKTLLDGKPLVDGTLTAAKFNETLADDLFKKPAQ